MQTLSLDFGSDSVSGIFVARLRKAKTWLALAHFTEISL